MFGGLLPLPLEGASAIHLPSHRVVPTFLPYLPKLPFSGSGSRAEFLRKESLSAHPTTLWSSIFAFLWPLLNEEQPTDRRFLLVKTSICWHPAEYLPSPLHTPVQIR